MLPSTQDGYLPYFLLYTSISAFIHTIVCYLSPPATATAQFKGPTTPPPSALLAHVYATKNFYTALIRLYAAYHLDNKELYTLGMFTFVGVLWLYGTELLVYRTMRLKEGIIPFLMAGSGVVWMGMQRGWYTR